MHMMHIGFADFRNHVYGRENPKVSAGVADHLLPGMSEERPWRIHSSWVTRLLYLTHSSSLLSSSMDGQLMMLDLEKQRRKWSTKEHLHGICAFAYGR
jgi:WD40 repeat protein